MLGLFNQPVVLLLLLLSVRGGSSAPTVPLSVAELVLQTSRRINLDDVMHRQLLYTLVPGLRSDQLIIKHIGGAMPPRLFVTVVPCSAPLEVDFSSTSAQDMAELGLRPAVLNDHLLADRRDAGSKRWVEEASSRGVTYKLSTQNLHFISLRLRRQSSLPGGGQAAKALIRLSTRYPGVELGSSRYNVGLCARDPKNQPEMLSVRLQPLLNAPLSMPGSQVCLVANRVRPLPEYCSAQIGLANRLPFSRSDLLDGLAELKLSESAGEFVFKCVNFSHSLWRVYPELNVSALLGADPAVLYVNVFLVRPGPDGQPDTTAWQTVRYYRRDPANPLSPSQPPVSCSGGQFVSEGSVELVSESPGVYSADLAVQLPPDASLLVRPSRLELLGSAYSVRLSPYTGQSASFEALAESGALSCSDSVWAYGGVACEQRPMHPCLNSDEEACRYDSVRLTVRMENKRIWGPASVRWLLYRRKDRVLSQPRKVQWQFVRSAAGNTRRIRDAIEPRIGRVSDAMLLLRRLWLQRRAWRSRTGASIEDEPNRRITNGSGIGIVMRNEWLEESPEPRHQDAVLRHCHLALETDSFNDTRHRLMRRSAECYRSLLELHVLVRKVCRRARDPGDVLEIVIAAPETSGLTATYSPGVNRYLCLVFELAVDEPPMTYSNRPRRHRRRRRQRRRKRLLKFERQVRNRLLQSLSTFELPTAENQGFGEALGIRQPSHRRLRQRSRSRRRHQRAKIVGFKLIHRSVSPAGQKTSPVFLPGVTARHALNSPRRRMYFAVYIYAAPEERLTSSGLGPSRGPGLPSLFAFRLVTLDRKWLTRCQLDRRNNADSTLD